MTVKTSSVSGGLDGSRLDKRVDVRARVLWHDHDAGRARPSLRCAARVVAVHEVVEAGRVRGVRGRARVARLLEVEDAGLIERVEKAAGRGQDQSR